MIAECLKANLHYVMLLYGFAIFTMGVAIAVALKFTESGFVKLAKSLPWLGAFGILHGVVDVGEIIFFMSGRSLGAFEEGLYLVLKMLSFVFLMHFGAKLLYETTGKNKWIISLAPVFFVFWLAYFSNAYFTFDFNTSKQWIGLGDAVGRYLLAFPGSFIAGYALLLQIDGLQAARYSFLRKYVAGASLALFGYGIFGGLLVMPADIFLARYFNTETFLNFFGFPGQIIRGFSGITEAYCIIMVLSILDIENRNLVEELKKRQAVQEERIRIARDMHDGVMQSIYVVGLNLDYIGMIMQEKPEEAKEKMQQTVQKLGEVNKSIRGLIEDWRSAGVFSSSFQEDLAALVEDMVVDSHMTINYKIHGTHGPCLDPVKQRHLYYIAQETLQNIIKHANATRVDVDLIYHSDGLELIITDNGKGFNKELIDSSTRGEHQGLRNISERVNILGGNFLLESTIDKGTRVNIKITCGGV